MHQPKKRDLPTATRNDSEALALRDSDCPDEIAEFSECLAIKPIVDPSTLAAIRDRTGILQRLEMEREARLPGLQCTGQVADTPFPIGELVEDAEPCLVSQGVKQTGAPFPISRHR